MRNILQPLIENYFEHGLDSRRADNYLKLSGAVVNENEIRLTIQDNGRGISDENLAKLRSQLSAPIAHQDTSYGLKNLHQRIQLCYGKKFGLLIEHSIDNGLAVSICLPIINRDFV